mmetsp:Transcript_12564/g.10727  ORF Transcript_12564/g.10727 Transcript_12564/m.10727 type:complete len:83 (+) Transcript_12564:27-275(+)
MAQSMRHEISSNQCLLTDIVNGSSEETETTSKLFSNNSSSLLMPVMYPLLPIYRLCELAMPIKIAAIVWSITLWLLSDMKEQ